MRMSKKTGEKGGHNRSKENNMPMLGGRGAFMCPKAMQYHDKWKTHTHIQNQKPPQVCKRVRIDLYMCLAAKERVDVIENEKVFLCLGQCRVDGRAVMAVSCPTFFSSSSFFFF